MRLSSSSSYCSGGVTLRIYSGTSLAPIRLAVVCSTLKDSVTGGLRTDMMSPIMTILAGLAVTSLIATLPFRQASCAMERVLKRRTAQRKLSIRTGLLMA